MSPLDLAKPCTQEQFGELVGISQQAVSELLSRGVLTRDDSAHDWLLAYTRNLREQAAGRATDGTLDLASERARLSSAQADRVEMLNAQTRRELAPYELLKQAMARAGRQIAGVLEAIPIALKRRFDLPPEAIEFITNEIARARNLAVEAAVNDLDEMDIEDVHATA